MDSNPVAIYCFSFLPPPYLLIAILHSMFNQLGRGCWGGGVASTNPQSQRHTHTTQITQKGNIPAQHAQDPKTTHFPKKPLAKPRLSNGSRNPDVSCRAARRQTLRTGRAEAPVNYWSNRRRRSRAIPVCPPRKKTALLKGTMTGTGYN